MILLYSLIWFMLIDLPLALLRVLVAIEIDGTVIDATLRNGVARWPAKDFAKRYREIKTVPLLVSDPSEFRAFLSAQVGKRYDWTALVALPFRADWQDQSKWFCSELAASAISRGGRSLRLPSYRVTPRDLWVAL
jgi:hypothetical protein